MGKDVIIACDFQSGQECLNFLEAFGEKKPFIKIGMELFYAEGPDLVHQLKDRGYRIFLDLKLHDIPNTVMKAMQSLAKLKVDMINCHATGTVKMMEAAVQAFEGWENPPLLIGVTQLTSTTEDRLHSDLLVKETMEDYVLHLAKNTKSAGLNGVVCSPLEAPAVHQTCGSDFITVTPGVRFEEDSKDDQARVTSPEQAKILGADYIVMGRSITRSADPVSRYEKALKDFIHEWPANRPNYR